jgi:poly(A) polymerase
MTVFRPIFDDKNVQKLFRVFRLEGHELRLVGGCVRDALLKRPIGDKDFATTATPQHMMLFLPKYGIHAVPTGIEFGTVTAVLDNRHFEITTLRADIKTDGRHAEVRFSQDWKGDAARRDFTVNALSLDLDGNIHDYFDGLKDLKKKALRFIGKPEQRLKEDYLRLLRYFRFASVLDWKLNDKKILALCKKNAPALKKLSRERTQSELYKTLSGPAALRAVKLIDQYKILGQKLNIIRLKKCLALDKENDPFRRFLALAPTWDFEALSAWIVLSNAQKRRIAALQNVAAMPRQPLAHRLYYHGVEAAMDYAILTGKKGDLVKSQRWKKPSFPLKAEDIMELAGGPGPALGRMLKEAEAYWVEKNFRPTKKSLLDRLNDR